MAKCDIYIGIARWFMSHIYNLQTSVRVGKYCQIKYGSIFRENQENVPRIKRSLTFIVQIEKVEYWVL